MRAEAARLEGLKEQIETKLSGDPRWEALKSQIRLEMTRDGLRIQIVDGENRPMFASGSAAVQPYMRELLREIGTILQEVPNKLTLEGHTDSQPFAAGGEGYGNWELSADRANSSRRELKAGGLADDRVLRIQGMAASTPLDAKDPAAPQNRRISIIVMNREAENRIYHTAAEEAPDVNPLISAMPMPAKALEAQARVAVGHSDAAASSPAASGR